MASTPPSACMAVGLLGSAATLVAWVWAFAGEGAWRWAVPLASLALALHLLFELRAAPARRLRWDGEAWWVQPARTPADELRGDAIRGDAIRGEMTVAIDLGRWVLLRFVVTGSRWVSPGLWLPVQRRRVEGDWHALRCALYSPRPRLPVAASEALDG